MTAQDVPKLNLEESWMYDRFYDCIARNMGPTYIIEEEGVALCAFGAMFEWGNSGACEVWFNLIEKRRVFNLVRIIKRVLPKLVRKHKVTRMQAIVRSGSKANNRFVKFMGFENETPNGMKNKLPNDETAYLYSRCI